MEAVRIRQIFLDFFEARQHKIVSAAPIVNQSDPQLLFVNAGMNPFKNIFLGHESPCTRRVANAQPCLRVAGKHNDLEEVGVDTYHHTLFEMLGNWSFGDYSKKEAIDWAWELLVVHYKIPQDRLYVTLFEGDEQEQIAQDRESYQFWRSYLPEEQILYASKKDNFWEMGATGPCGPCTEIHIDMRNEKERKESSGRKWVNQGHPQVVEVWNLVFIQYQRLHNGSLQPLDRHYVDTGMGLERLAMVLQDKQSTYDTDLFAPLLDEIAQRTDISYGTASETDVAMRVIADHLRAIVWILADGQQPSHTGAGYVLRRLLRRAMRYGYTHLNIREPILHEMVHPWIKSMKVAYPHLVAQETRIIEQIAQEERTFLSMLVRGVKRLHRAIESLKPGDQLDGRVAFELYDTYGFPYDLTALITKEQKITIDQKGFEWEMKMQKKRSQKAAVVEKEEWQEVNALKSSIFVGYDQTEVQAHIVKYRRIKKKGKEYYQIVLDETPFYPEGGGQVGDQGILTEANGHSIVIVDTQKENDLIVHYSTALPQQIDLPLKARVNVQHRQGATCNHTATHLLLASLQQILGPHVQQQGSLVTAKELRFDFNHSSLPTQEQLFQIEQKVNHWIRSNIKRLEKRGIPLQQARDEGALMLPGEKYGETVRVITFDREISHALCGGTHVSQTGEIGFFKIIQTKSTGAGIRRILALTGEVAEEWVAQEQRKLRSIGNLLRTAEPVHGVEQMHIQKKKIEKTLKKLEERSILWHISQLQNQIIEKQPHTYLVTQVHAFPPYLLRSLAMALQRQTETSFVVLATEENNEITIVIQLNVNTALDQSAQEILTFLQPYWDGQGGGSRTRAVAKGTGGQQLVNDLLHVIKKENIK